MPLQYQEITLRDWDRAKKILSVDSTGWAWRGHRDARWPLKNSLERAITRPETRRRIRKVERTLYQSFTRRAHHYLEEDLPAPDDYLQWFSIMQHYGSPTRLLDWTYSPYIAIFFSLEGAADPAVSSAVWAINLEWCRQQATEWIRNQLVDEPDFVVPGINIWEPSRFKQLFIDSPLDFIAPVEPYRMNERLTRQQGLFLCQANLEKSFEESLAAYATDEKDSTIFKFVLPNCIRFQALTDLNLMGLSRATLFPGIDGFAQSLQHVIVQMEDPSLEDRAKHLPDEARRYMEEQESQ